MSDDDSIDTTTVTNLLIRHIGPALRCTSVSRGAVGNGQETWLVDAEDGTASVRSFVLRRSARAGVLDDTDRAHEFRTLRLLDGHGLLTPRAHWLETEPSSLGRPFFVMDRLPGRPSTPRSPADAATIARDLGRRVAELHAARLPVASTDSTADTRAQVERWRLRYLSRRVAPVPLITGLLAWLDANVPTDGAAPHLLWGDAGPHNVLVEDGRISALLDWELSHEGHPLEDLGAAVWACLGTYPEDEVVAGYEEVSGDPVDRTSLAYFAVLGCVSRTVMQLAGIDSFVRGQTNALNLVGLGLTLPIANLQRAARYAGWPDPGDAGGTDSVASVSDDLRIRPDVAETLTGVARFLADDLLPQTESAHFRRGLKTAVALLAASARRNQEDPARDRILAARLDNAFDLLADAGLLEPGSARDAAALDRAAGQIEAAGVPDEVRAGVRRALLADLIARAAPLEPIRTLYGRDVEPGPSFRR